jgi:SAM-dependent methyltransferase
MDIDEVPSPIDFHDPYAVQEWIKTTASKRPWRPDFFRKYVEALGAKFDRPFSVLELGSGPGFLAERVLECCTVSHYALVDFSAIMLTLARQRLEPFIGRIDLLQRDFRSSDWTRDLERYDAIISLQAVHEVRHKQRIPSLFGQVYELLAVQGLFLFCDHYVELDSTSNLFLTITGHRDTLLAANFRDVQCLLDKGSMALWQAKKL